MWNLGNCKTRGKYNIVLKASIKNKNYQQLHTKYILLLALDLWYASSSLLSNFSVLNFETHARVLILK